ncbi:Predicted amino acid racemase [Alkalithermobacter thermoalcaliphilus JW-YL-7 = DSM 7308]|uniref:ornithine racemase n=1 Tax=Alkalithermobacter thermoalcaliphilus JW-YL-7 = DSM 7308 TaxID=1121328 RepID=A0A150FP92_CLOPD|nr:alanine racemase domain protein [[Clostridium] paradoxum JW-YL-7 = DSM 7308]SHK51181.1 Predicted amino acid racemase [[Clostridium] paradoxum JW-YL-7 = DSM 7308]
MYPRLEIDIQKIRHNAKLLVDKCKKENIQIAAVTKVYCAFPEIVEAIKDTGIKYIADSRIQNLKKLKHINLPKILLRIPMMSEVEELVRYVDISLNSEIDVIRKIDQEAKKINKVQKIALMVDLGDLREGYFNEEELFDCIEQVLKLENIKLVGVGTNLTCYGAIIPSKENTQKLVDIAKKIEKRYKIDIDFISAGNSSSLHLIDKNQMPQGVSNLRLGEAIALGRETAYGDKIEGAYQDAFKLICEIVELKEKPSVPIGEIGMDAFGNKPVYEDRGIRKRAIIGIGKQDINISAITPIDTKIDILGASSDHLILDVTESDINYKVGDKVEFNLEYGALMSAATSEYVYKVFKG